MSALKAKKWLGQHFLKNESICTRIVALLEAGEEDQILEIGPGPGALTGVLQNMPHSKLVLLEKDAALARERQKSATARTQTIIADALLFDWQRLCAAGSWKIIGNLPYNIASPLVWDILSRCSCLVKAVFMVQKEVGLRLAARPGNKNYGALTVWTQSFANIELKFSLGPGAFWPPPKVDSSVLVFTPLRATSRPACPLALRKLLNLCFQNRRKQLGGIFKRAKLECLLEAMNELKLSLSLRPENLSPRDFQNLSELCRARLELCTESEQLPFKTEIFPRRSLANIYRCSQ